VVVVSASIGAGHDAAAAELARRLTRAGYAVAQVDFLDWLPGRLGERLRTLYQRQLAIAPVSWQWLLSALARSDVLAAVVVGLCRLACRAAVRELAAGRATGLVVSTYPLATQVLGGLTRRGRIRVPVACYLTDPAVHPLWLTAGIELYLASHPATVDQLRTQRRRPGLPVVLVAPVARPGFGPTPGPTAQPTAGSTTDARTDARLSPRPVNTIREALRERFGLPAGPLALVASGAWAVGDIEATAREIAASGVATPVVVCGVNDELRARLADLSPGVVLGWVADMPALMRAVDVAVLNSGGMTWAEAYISGLPTIHYRPLPGHGRANARLLDQAKQVPWVRTPIELPAALRHTLAAPPRPPVSASLMDPAVVLTALLTGSAGATEPAPVGVALPGGIDATGAVAGRVRRSWAVRFAGIGVATALLWSATAGTSLAVTRGFDTIRPDRPGRLSLVVDLDPHQPLTAGDISALRGADATMSISATMVNEAPTTVTQLAAASIPLLNAGAGAPFETGLIDRRAAIATTAHAITTLTTHAPRGLISNGDVDALDLALAARVHEHLVVPHATLDCHTPGPPLPDHGVVLLPVSRGCTLAHTLTRLHTTLTSRHQQFAPLAGIS
jgi:UDP-N-acetylglucosamine:LPS N-acetylglucosamine transferase